MAPSSILFTETNLFYELGKRSLINFSLLLSTILLFRKDRFLLRVLVVRIWLLKDLLKLNFPLPVRLNLFAAARLVLIFGIF
jgi:hypothetical protein